MTKFMHYLLLVECTFCHQAQRGKYLTLALLPRRVMPGGGLVGYGGNKQQLTLRRSALQRNCPGVRSELPPSSVLYMRKIPSLSLGLRKLLQGKTIYSPLHPEDAFSLILSTNLRTIMVS